MRSSKGVIAVVGLLVLIAAANYVFNMDPTQLAARGVGRDAHDQSDQDKPESEEAPTPDNIVPLGPEGAPVLIEVFYDGPSAYSQVFGPMMTAMEAQYSGHVRIEFLDLNEPEINARGVQMPLRGAQGLAVNGAVIKNVPGAGNFDTVAFVGQPMDRRWDETVLRQTVEYELTSKGITFERAAPPAAAPPAGGDEHAGHEH